MKRYVFLMICVLALVLAGCFEDTGEPVVTYEVSTTAATTQGPIISEPITEATQTQAPQEPKEPYVLVYDNAQMSRDAVGNVWLNVVAAVQNQSDEPLRMTQSTLLVTAESQEIASIEDAVCYPSVIEPGAYGYYYERVRVDTEVTKGLRTRVETNLERALDVSCVEIEDYRMYDLAYGIELYGSYEPIKEDGVVCVAAVLSDLNGDPVAIMADYFDASQTQFVLSSDKLPEGLHSASVTAQVFVYPYEG